MKRNLRQQNGRSRVGTGGKITLFALPSLMAAVSVHLSLPQIAALPASPSFLRPVGYVLFLLGLILSIAARLQWRKGFSEGELVTTGVYGIVRNPIYANLTFLVLPAIALMTLSCVSPRIFPLLGRGSGDRDSPIPHRIVCSDMWIS